MKWIALGAALAAACLLLGRRATALRLPADHPELRVRVHTQWNRDYLCLAAKVPDLMLTGSSTAPMSAPDQDDAIEFALAIPHPTGFSAHRLIISVAGGMTLLSRDAEGRWRLDDSWISGLRTLKYAVTADGTLNDPSDRDVGFLVECAIPWDFLGDEPPIGREIGFNVVCWMQGDSEGVTSWSPMVRGAATIGEVTRWGQMLVSGAPASTKAQGTRIESPLVSHTPFVDGKLAAEEWLTASTLHFDKPEPDLLIAPGPAEGGARPAAREAMALLLAIYRYDWRWHSSGGGAPLWTSDGAPAAADQPREGCGPWYSSDRVAWHRAQLQEIQRAGIDIILPRYCGHADARESWARLGLDYLTEALKYRRAGGESYPLVGMLLDTACLDGMDLRSEQGKRRLYAMIREFFLHISPEFWAEVGARPQEGRPGGVPLLLGDPEGLADWDGSFLGYCSQRFAEDFDGARLVWLGSSAWRTRGAEGFYAYVRLPDRTGFTREAVGGAPAVALSPGYCARPGETGGIRPRRQGRAYRADWQRVLAARPELVVIDSWNDFSNATEIAPSRQYGVSYVDATRYFKARMASEVPRHLRLKRQSAPRLLQPGADYLVELLVENIGTEDIETGARVTADYRIVRRSDGEVVQHKVAAQALRVLAGQTKRLPVSISARDDDGRPLPPGDYLFSLIVVRSRVAYFRSSWFTRTLAELTLPIAVGEPPARRATVLSTSLPSAIEWGDTQQVAVRLRNDGSRTWRQGQTSLAYRWLLEQHSDDAGAAPAAKLEGDFTTTCRADLPKDVLPGEVVSVLIPVAATDEQNALPAGGPGARHSCRIQWDLVEGKGAWFSKAGAPMRGEPIQVLRDHLGVVYESVEPPAVMEAGQKLEVELVLSNSGARVWRAGESSISPRWHRWDGREALPRRARTPLPLPRDVHPDAAVHLEVPLEAPAIPGPYWLTWGAAINGAGAAPHRNAPPVSPVMVRSSRTHGLDLSSLANVAALTTDSHRARGDFDGTGRSLPAEWLPPDQSGLGSDLYPSAYYAPERAHTLPFTFPDTGSGVGGAVACVGQSIPLGDAPAARVHLLAASTAGVRETTFGLKHPTGEVEHLSLMVPSWTQRDEAITIGAYAPYTRTLSGDDAAAPAYLYHLTLRPSSPTAVSLELPEAPWIRILAITVEEADLSQTTPDTEESH